MAHFRKKRECLLYTNCIQVKAFRSTYIYYWKVLTQLLEFRKNLTSKLIKNIKLIRIHECSNGLNVFRGKHFSQFSVGSVSFCSICYNICVYFTRAYRWNHFLSSVCPPWMKYYPSNKQGFYEAIEPWHIACHAADACTSEKFCGPNRTPIISSSTIQPLLNM